MNAPGIKSPGMNGPRMKSLRDQYFMGSINLEGLPLGFMPLG